MSKNTALATRFAPESGTELESSVRTLVRCSSAAARRLVPESVAARYTLLPLSLQKSSDDDDILTALAPEEFGAKELQEVRALVGIELIVDQHDPAILSQAIHLAYRGATPEVRDLISSIAISTGDVSFDADSSDGVVPRILNSILCHAWSRDASDIHFDPGAKSARVRLRVHGTLCEEKELEIPIGIYPSLVRRVKVLCKLDITRSDVPAEGAFRYSLSSGALRLRVSTLPQLDGEKLVLRINADGATRSFQLPNYLPHTLKSLGMSLAQSDIFRAYLALDAGCAILSGPTGSGKTTLLYAALTALADEATHIVTLEDPVEKRLSGVTQVEVRRDSGWGYEELLKSVLRQDPDVILLGEIRESLTADTAFQAALTGHLVLSTVHAGNCLEALIRLQSMLENFALLEAAMKLLISQRLVPKVCPGCVRKSRASAYIQKLFQLEEDVFVSDSIGCDDCRETGIGGRLGVFELLPITPGFRTDLGSLFGRANRLPLHELKQIARAHHYEPLGLRVREALISGQISPESACRALGLSPANQ